MGLLMDATLFEITCTKLANIKSFDKSTAKH